MPDNRTEYRVPVDWIWNAILYVTKALWFLVAVSIWIWIGEYVIGFVPLPGWMPGWLNPGAMIFGTAYIMWRVEGGKIRVRDGAISCPGVAIRLTTLRTMASSD